MIKLILSAVWVCIITLASSYVAASWKARGTIAACGRRAPWGGVAGALGGDDGP